MKNKKLLLGYLLAAAGLIFLIINAFAYFSDAEIDKPSLGGVLLICILGAVIISKNRNESN